jgi:hypothetical protein
MGNACSTGEVMSGAHKSFAGKPPFSMLRNNDSKLLKVRNIGRAEEFYVLKYTNV